MNGDVSSIEGLIATDGGDGVSLREAILAANATEGEDVIGFDLSLSGQTIALAGAQLESTDALVIDATALDERPVIDAGGLSRVIQADAYLRVAGLELANGAVDGPGGAIYSPSAELILEDTAVVDSKATGGGGGVFSLGGTRVVRSEIRGNSTTGDESKGGGVYSRFGAFEIEDSTISGNHTEGMEARGGGVYASSTTSITRSSISGNYTEGDSSNGGGIFTFYGAVTFVDSTVTDNYTLSTDSRGGGIAARGLGSPTIVLEETLVSRNHTEGIGASGGGVWSLDAPVEAYSSEISYNETRGESARGGGVYVEGEFVLHASVLRGNTTLGRNSGGGGAYTRSVVIDSSEISDNTTAGGGGVGGGLMVVVGSVQIIDSTLSNNRTSGPRSPGGAGYFDLRNSSEIRIDRSTITENEALGDDSDAGGLAINSEKAVITNTIIAANLAADRYADIRSTNSASVYAFNLIGDNDGVNLAESSTPDAAGNLVGSSAGAGVLDPRLAPLGDNGGPTRTHDLLNGSPAFNAGDPAILSDSGYDQRGEPFPRVTVGRADIGAVERYFTTYTVDRSTDEFDGNYREGDLSLREAIFLANESLEVARIQFSPTFAGRTILLTKGELEISAPLIVDASNLLRNVEIDARGQSRVLSITAEAGDVTLVGVDLTGGRTVENNPTIFDYTNSGGAIRSLSDGLLTIEGSLISWNRTQGHGAQGGAIFATGDVRLVQSTLSGNKTEGLSSNGGAIAAHGNLEIVRSTLSENQAAGASGGGIWFSGEGLSVEGSIVAGNTATGGGNDLEPAAGSFSLRYSLVADANGPSGPDNALLIALASGQGNLFTTSGTLDAGVAPLGDYGGRTLTHALLPGSVAINAGEPETSDVVLDVRGYPFDRVAEGRIDMGAYESQALSLVVDTTEDAVDGDFSVGRLSLREAAAIAEANPGADTIVFSPELAGQTISLIYNEFHISDTVTIDGTALAEPLTIDAHGESRIFEFLDDSNDYTLAGLVLTGGRATRSGGGGAIISASSGILTLERMTIQNSGTTGREAPGGGVYTEGGLRIIDSLLTGNTTVGQDSPGGAAWTEAGDLSIENSTIEHNHTEGFRAHGGGVGSKSGNVRIVSSKVNYNYISGSSAQGGGVVGYKLLTIHASTIDSNSVRGNSYYDNGGGVYGEDVILTESVVSDNYVNGLYGHGGGVFGRSLEVTGSTIEGNSLTGEKMTGAGLFSFDLTVSDSLISGNHIEGPQGKGGGIGVYGPGSIYNSTISGNHTEGEDSRGGGLFRTGVHQVYDRLTIEQSTITGNSASSGGGVWEGWFPTQIQGSIVAGNSSLFASPDLHSSSSPNIVFSLIGDNAGTTLAETRTPDENGNLIGSSAGSGVIDPMLGPLADNGGRNQTHAILPGSPAIEAGDLDTDDEGYDQRGEPFERVSGRRIDIGAFEALSLYVDNQIDETDGDYSSGNLSLREALEIANARPGNDLILFDEALSGRTILLDGEALTLTETITIDSSALDARVQIDAQGLSRIFEISAGADNVTLKSLKLRGGRTETDFYYGSYESQGGAIISGSEGMLFLSQVVLTDNTAIGGYARGGAIDTKGDLELADSVVSGNHTEGPHASGGGLYVRGQLTLTDSILERNYTSGGSGSGGGAFVFGDALLQNSWVLDNRTEERFSPGGGLYVRGGLVIERGGVERNTTLGVSSPGGGVFVGGDATFSTATIGWNTTRGDHSAGGAVFTEGRLSGRDTLFRDNTTLGGESPGGAIAASEVNLLQSTVSGSLTHGAESSGGGVSATGAITLAQSTVVNNHALFTGVRGGGLSADGTVEISGSILAKNTATGGAPDLDSDALVTTVQYSFIGDTDGLLQASSDSPDASGNLIGDSSTVGAIDPLLGPLADNGGPTATHLPLTSSPIIDAGDPLFDPQISTPPLASDQRGAGLPRVWGERIDLGAIEWVGNIVVDSLDGGSDGDVSPGHLSLREAIALANLNPGADTIGFDPSLAGGTILLGGAELELTEAATLDASMANEGVTIDAERLSRVLHFTASTGDFSIVNLRIQNGLTTGDNPHWDPPSPPPSYIYNGGAIRSITSGKLIITRSVVSDSEVEGVYTSGGGVFAEGPVVITESSIQRNHAPNEIGGFGGGILAPSVTVRKSSITHNTSATSGGGVYSQFVFVDQSEILGNASYSGAGLRARNAEVARSLIQKNTASSRGGGMYVYESALITESLIGNNTSVFGAGVYSANRLVVEQSTFSGNKGEPSRSTRGGAIWSSGYTRLTNSTVTFNSSSLGAGLYASGEILVVGSILTANLAANPSYEVFLDDEGPNSLEIRHSLIGSRTDEIVSLGEDNVIADDPMLAPLADNGGPTPTHLPLPGSPAIDAGDPTVEFAHGEFDQRGMGYFRLAGGGVDIGAIEIQADAPPLIGDYNGNGVVDGADFTVWRDALDEMVAPYEGADGDGDGVITRNDYTVWTEHFGETLSSPLQVTQAQGYFNEVAGVDEAFAADVQAGDSMLSPEYPRITQAQLPIKENDAVVTLRAPDEDFQADKPNKTSASRRYHKLQVGVRERTSLPEHDPTPSTRLDSTLSPESATDNLLLLLVERHVRYRSTDSELINPEATSDEAFADEEDWLDVVGECRDFIAAR
ncbi:choice-of-anchor Q domain-containing protein [Pseudobythopirellula maris]|uniref:choice-of-anchor Q domain-containing protein n=1 Tax=Pseudobythopirellula maris TaxID=2527991 RepID=UPI0018D2D064|nr:choice-of-anchor Q domain-containing protein [Pseudobythopirellula maris]